MSSRVLFVDDDPDIRTVVELSLNLDPDLVVKTCADGSDALVVSAEWSPALILCDVTMPGMDGPTLLARLRDNPATANIPIVFMSAHAQTSDVERFKAIGAAAVFTKPFDPVTLAAKVCEQLYLADMDTARTHFVERMRKDAAALAECRDAQSADPDQVMITEDFQSCVHKLSGAAGVFNFQAVSSRAAALELAIGEKRAGHSASETLTPYVDKLLACIDCESIRGPSPDEECQTLFCDHVCQAGDPYAKRG